MNKRVEITEVLETLKLNGYVKKIYTHHNASTGELELNVEFNADLFLEEYLCREFKNIDSCAIWE